MLWLTLGLHLVYTEYMKTTKELVIATTPSSEGLIAERIARSRTLKRWGAKIYPWRKIHARSFLPDITVLYLGNLFASDASLQGFIRDLAAKQQATVDPSFIVLAFANCRRPAADKLIQLLRPFPKPERVEISWCTNAARLSAVVEAIEPKLEVLRETARSAAEAPRPSPLDQIEKVLAATRDLRSKTGNLSAQRIADLYGVSLSELGKWIGRSRQALNKTPDAESLQDALGFYERIARLRLRLSDEDFRKWLRTPNALLDGNRPLDLLAQKRMQILSDFVDDLLTGNPT